MPLDSKRNCYSEATQHPIRFQEHQGIKTDSLVTSLGLRKDKRKPEDVRPIFMETGIISRSKGSAFVEMGDTKVMCACYGPRRLQNREHNMNKGVLVCELRFASFAQRSHKTDQLSAEEKELSSLLRDSLSASVILDKFPRAEVDVYVTVLEEGGSALAAAIIASSLALADASIELYGLVSACSLSMLNQLRLFDPTEEEETACLYSTGTRGRLTIAFVNGIDQISMTYQHGYMASPDISRGVLNLVTVSKALHPLMQECLQSSLERKFANMKS